MADSPKSKLSRTLSVTFSRSQRMFAALTPKALFESVDSMTMSPTSILDSKPFSVIRNPFCWRDLQKPIKPDHEAKPMTMSRCWEPKGVGLAAIDWAEPECGMRVLLGPAMLKSRGEFGSKSKSRTSSASKNSIPGSPASPRLVHRALTAAEETEMSEDYTRVICHGANPRTTHIFGDCVVENCCGMTAEISAKESLFFIGELEVSSPSDMFFLSHCCSCRKKLEAGVDIYLLKGEKAFCSEDCRSEELDRDDFDISS